MKEEIPLSLNTLLPKYRFSPSYGVESLSLLRRDERENYKGESFSGPSIHPGS
jgi:hypothetical protein